MARQAVFRRPTMPRAVAFRGALLALSIATVSFLRYATALEPTLHQLALRLYYLPILAAGYWFGPAGGLVLAAVSSFFYVRHVVEAVPGADTSRYAEITVFFLTGLCTGLLARAQRAAAARLQRAVTTLETANQALRDSHAHIRRVDRLKTLGEVAAGLAHEIRHPLASIFGALEIIEARAQTESPEAEFSRLAMTEVQRLDKLVWEFLRFARPHAPELQSMPLHDVVARVATLLGVEAERARVRLEIEPADTRAHVSIDPLQMEQVLL